MEGTESSPASIRVLHVTRETQADKRFGLGRSLAVLCEELKARGMTVDYLSQEDLGMKSRHYLRRIHALIVATRCCPISDALLWGLMERFNMGRLAAKVAVRENPTHVHCHDPLIGAGFWLFSWLHLGKPVRWGVTEHGHGCYAQAIHEDGAPLETGTMRWMRNLERRILRTAAWVIAPTRSGIAQLARDLGVHPIPKTWHAIPHARPVLTVHAKQEARALLHWEPRAFYIIAVGRLAPLKRFPLIIEACSRIRSDKEIRLVIVGAGDRQPCEERATRFGMAERVHYAVADDVSPYYFAADLYVSASDTESFGLANLEAMVAGLPMICTAVGGVPEVLGGAALLVPSGEVEVLADALQTLVDRGDFREWLAGKALERGRGWTGISEVGRDYATVYREALR